MKTIYKYRIETFGINFVEMPADAEVLCAQLQRGETCLWAKVDTEAKTEVRSFLLAGTGQPLPDQALHYIDTIQLTESHLVLHLFEVER